MRTNIDISDDLMASAMEASGLRTKRETVEAGLKLLAQRRKAYAGLLALGGILKDEPWPEPMDDGSPGPRVRVAPVTKSAPRRRSRNAAGPRALVAAT